MRVQKRRLSAIVGGLIWSTIILLGCNLGTAPDQEIPTLVPLNTAAPVATLGYNGQDSGLPAGSNSQSNPSQQISDISAELNSLVQQVDQERLMNHVRTLESFHTRHVNSSTSSATQGIGAARTYIYRQFEEIRNQAPHRNFTPQPLPFDMTYNNIPTRQENVLGVLSGTEIGGGFLVIGAHYDSIMTNFEDASSFAPGANDNATGVAAVIELARVMSQRQYRTSIIFVAFSAEEVGARGSEAFVDYATARNLDIIGMVNIDSIGNANSRSGQVDRSLRIFSCQDEGICADARSSRHMARTAEFIGFNNAASMPMTVENSADREGRFGDHFSFARAGYPAIRFINTMEEFGNGSQSDTWQYVEPDYLRQAVQSILLVIISLADGPPPPRQITIRALEGGVPSLRWEPSPDAAGYVIVLRDPGSQLYNNQLECTPQTNYCNGTSLTWDQLGNYAGVAIAAKGANGLIGRLSEEYVIQQGR